jgi:formimidoylglutamate deiminase
VADHLWLGAVAGGARASGRSLHGLAVGEQADLVVLDGSGVLSGLAPAQALASHVFAHTGPSAVRDVFVAGVPRIRDGEHALQHSAARQFVATRSALLRES